MIKLSLQKQSLKRKDENTEEPVIKTAALNDRSPSMTSSYVFQTGSAPTLLSLDLSL